MTSQADNGDLISTGCHLWSLQGLFSFLLCSLTNCVEYFEKYSLFSTVVTCNLWFLKQNLYFTCLLNKIMGHFLFLASITVYLPYNNLQLYNLLPSATAEENSLMFICWELWYYPDYKVHIDPLSVGILYKEKSENRMMRKKWCIASLTWCFHKEMN